MLELIKGEKNNEAENTPPIDVKRFEDPNILGQNDDFTVNIHAHDQKIDYETKGSVRIEGFTQAILTVILAVYQKSLESVESKDQKHAKEVLFDLLNQSFSGVLRLFAPEIALRPDLTEDAILQAENDLINKAYEHASRSSKRRARREVQKLQKKGNKNE